MIYFKDELKLKAIEESMGWSKIFAVVAIASIFFSIYLLRGNSLLKLSDPNLIKLAWTFFFISLFLGAVFMGLSCILLTSNEVNHFEEKRWIFPVFIWSQALALLIGIHCMISFTTQNSACLLR